MIKVKHKGNFNKSTLFFKRNEKPTNIRILEKYALIGLENLKVYTPVSTGKTAKSWHYRIFNNKKSVSIVWINTNVIDGINIAMIIQYGHGTKNGAYINGIDYINPALKEVFNALANDVWKEVIKNEHN